MAADDDESARTIADAAKRVSERDGQREKRRGSDAKSDATPRREGAASERSETGRSAQETPRLRRCRMPRHGASEADPGKGRRPGSGTRLVKNGGPPRDRSGRLTGHCAARDAVTTRQQRGLVGEGPAEDLLTRTGHLL